MALYFVVPKINTLLFNGNSKNTKYSLPEIPRFNKNTTLATDTEIETEKKASIFYKLSSDKQDKKNTLYIDELLKSIRVTESKYYELERLISALRYNDNRSDIYNRIVNSESFYDLVNNDELTSEESLVFFHQFTRQYLNLKYKKNKIEQYNFFRLKRMLTNVTLNVIDSFKEKNDLTVWYAIISQKLSTKFPDIWINKIRQNSDIDLHLNWAKQMTRDHIKSEIIIKLNIVMNSLRDQNPINNSVNIPKLPIINRNPTKITKDTTQSTTIKTRLSDQKKYQIINEMIKEAIIATPSENQLEFFFSIFQRGSSFEGVYHALILNNEYYQLEQDTSMTVRPEIYPFIQNLMESYTGFSFSIKRIQILNLYALKKVCIEKFIEMFDALNKKSRLSLVNWNAHLASELANRFPTLWKDIVRKRQSKLKQREWASKTAIQSLKAEMVIKLHKAFNSFLIL